MQNGSRLFLVYRGGPGPVAPEHVETRSDLSDIVEEHRPQSLRSSGSTGHGDLAALDAAVPSGHRNRTRAPPEGPQKQDIDEKVVIEALLRLLPKKRDHHDPSRFPPPLRQILEQNLPKKGLKAFLVAHSDLFEVHGEDGSKKWTLSINPSAPTAGCEAHQPSSSSSAPPPVPTAPASGCGGMPGSSADPSPRRPPTPPPPPPPGLVGGETQWVNQPLPSHNPGWSWHDDWRGWTGWTDESNWSGGWQQRDEQQEKQALRAELVREGLLEPEALTVGTPWPPNVNAWQ